jgi:hypothetical protein
MTDIFALRLRDAEREVCQFGLMRQGTMHTSLSGAEWARVLPALATVCGPKDGKLGILIPEDRMWDPKTLFATMQAFRGIPQQVLLTSTVMPQNEADISIPDGWTVVTTKHRSDPEATALAEAKKKRPDAAKPVTAAVVKKDEIASSAASAAAAKAGIQW